MEQKNEVSRRKSRFIRDMIIYIAVFAGGAEGYFAGQFIAKENMLPHVETIEEGCIHPDDIGELVARDLNNNSAEELYITIRDVEYRLSFDENKKPMFVDYTNLNPQE